MMYEMYECVNGARVKLDVGVSESLPGRLSIGSHGYAQLCGATKGTVVLLHRWLLGLEPNDGMVGDHINFDKLDNRMCNLRAVTPSESNMNRRIKARDLPVGIYKNRHGKYEAKVRRSNITKHVGSFTTVEEAVRARDAHLHALHV